MFFLFLFDSFVDFDPKFAKKKRRFTLVFELFGFEVKFDFSCGEKYPWVI